MYTHTFIWQNKYMFIVKSYKKQAIQQSKVKSIKIISKSRYRELLFTFLLCTSRFSIFIYIFLYMTFTYLTYNWKFSACLLPFSFQFHHFLLLLLKSQLCEPYIIIEHIKSLDYWALQEVSKIHFRH